MTGPLIPYQEAVNIILRHCSSTGQEAVALNEALGRIVASAVVSTVDMPRFDNSSVDGFAVRSDDLQPRDNSLPVIGTVRAGEFPSLHVGQHQAMRVFTGAPVPDGADAIVMQEDVWKIGDSIRFDSSNAKTSLIRRRGEDFFAGSILVSPGVRATAPILAVAASAGQATISVANSPTVSIVTTGDELIPAGQTLLPGQIYASNGVGLEAALRGLSITEVRRLHVIDDANQMRECLAAELEASDIVVTSGGVSVGEYDLVKGALGECGVETKFWGVAIRPGQPMYFGIRDSKLVFGLPGNPVSSMVCFYMFVRPAMLAILGAAQASPLRARISESIERLSGRMEFVRANLENRQSEVWVRPFPSRGSHLMGGLVDADCLLHFPSEVKSLSVGEEVDVTRLEW